LVFLSVRPQVLTTDTPQTIMNSDRTKKKRMYVVYL